LTLFSLSTDQNDLNRSGNNYLGKLRSNFVGTEFQIFDDGVNPKESEADEGPAANSKSAYFLPWSEISSHLFRYLDKM
jgi:hypothetical protein